MAKAKKAATRNKISLTSASLVAAVNTSSKSADVSAIFKSGLGQMTAMLFRKGVLINMQSISSSGTIHFSDVAQGDSISINGVCSGTADITISVPTEPASPQHFEAQNIHCGFDIL